MHGMHADRYGGPVTSPHDCTRQSITDNKGMFSALPGSRLDVSSKRGHPVNNEAVLPGHLLIRSGEYTQQRDFPACFAAYMAMSLCRTRSSSFMAGSVLDAMPILADMTRR